MAEQKAPDPFWPAEKVQAVADKLYRDMAPLMKTEGELLLAHTVAELMAAHFQIVEALMAGRRADQSACDLSNALKNQWNVQMDGVSRRLEVSNNVPSNLTKGSGTNLSAVIYGNFADLLIGLYGTLEILVDPYTDFAKGTTGVRALQTIDIAVRHAESFAAMKDAIA